MIGLVQLAVLALPRIRRGCRHRRCGARRASASSPGAAARAREPRVDAVLPPLPARTRLLDAAADADRPARERASRLARAALARDWPDDVDRILAANNAPASLVLRANRRRTSAAALTARLLDAGRRAVHEWLPDAVVLEQSTDVTALPGYSRGDFLVQDGAAQPAPDLLILRDGLRVLMRARHPAEKPLLPGTSHAGPARLDRDPQRLVRNQRPSPGSVSSRRLQRAMLPPRPTGGTGGHLTASCSTRHAPRPV